MSPESRLRSATRVCFLGQNHRNAESTVQDPRGPGLSLLPPPRPAPPTCAAWSVRTLGLVAKGSGTFAVGRGPENRG